MSIIRLSAAAAITATSMLLVGCSVSGHAEKAVPAMSADKLADSVAEQLAATTGQAKPHVTCPEDLAAAVGTTTRCKLTAGDGSTLGVSVKVTSVKGSQIHFDIKADSHASPAQ